MLIERHRKLRFDTRIERKDRKLCRRHRRLIFNTKGIANEAVHYILIQQVSKPFSKLRLYYTKQQTVSRPKKKFFLLRLDNTFKINKQNFKKFFRFRYLHVTTSRIDK